MIKNLGIKSFIIFSSPFIILIVHSYKFRTYLDVWNVGLYFPDPTLPPYLRRLDPAERNGPRVAAARVLRPLGQTWARHGDRHKHRVGDYFAQPAAVH